jgi:hypothetical protein
MSSRIFSSRHPGLAILVPVTVSLMLMGCGKTDSEEKTADTPSVPASVANLRATFTADPNPVTTADSHKLGVTKLTWSTTATKAAEIHVGKPDGALLCVGYATGACTTGQWVTDGMTFYLQDSGAPKPTDASATLATVTAKVQ